MLHIGSAAPPSRGVRFAEAISGVDFDSALLLLHTFAVVAIALFLDHLHREEPVRVNLIQPDPGAHREGRPEVSCWHANPVESAAMWSLYGTRGEGLAIRSTLERFRQSFKAEEPKVHGGMVRYVDFETHRAPVNVIDWATLKRPSFEHEREFREIILGASQQDGLAVHVDIDMLISEVYISPTAPRWYADLIRRVCAHYGLSADVRQSDLLCHPAYLGSRSTANYPA